MHSLIYTSQLQDTVSTIDSNEEFIVAGSLSGVASVWYLCVESGKLMTSSPSKTHSIRHLKHKWVSLIVSWIHKGSISLYLPWTLTYLNVS